MSAVETVEREGTERFVAMPEVGMVFMAYREDLTLVKTPVYATYGPGGQKTGETAGERIAFRNNVLRIPAAETMTIEDGRVVETADVLEWLEKHRLNGQMYEGFWRVDPVAPAPGQDEMQAIADAAMALDIEKLEAIFAQETAGYGREAVIKTVETSLQRARATKTELEARQQEAIAQAMALGRAEALREVKTAREAAAAHEAEKTDTPETE